MRTLERNHNYGAIFRRVMMKESASIYGKSAESIQLLMAQPHSLEMTWTPTIVSDGRQRKSALCANCCAGDATRCRVDRRQRHDKLRREAASAATLLAATNRSEKSAYPKHKKQFQPIM